MRMIAAALALLTATPALAQEGPSEAEKAATALVEKANAAGRTGDFKAMLVALDAALAKIPEPGPMRSGLSCYRASALLYLNDARAKDAVKLCRTLLPDHPSSMMLEAQMLLRDDKIEPGTRMLIRAVRGDSALLQRCDAAYVDVIRSLFRKLNYAALQPLRAELVEALAGTACGSDDPRFFSDVLGDAVLQWLEAGDPARARAALPDIVDPRQVLEMLLDRRYAPLWPDLERMTGGTLEVQRAALLARVRASIGDKPSLDDAIKLADAEQATGHAKDALATLSRALADTTLEDPGGYARSTITVRIAELQNRLDGDVTAVTAAMRAELDRGGIAENDGQWNIVPNLAQWLIIYGQPEEALRVLARFDASKGARLDAPAALGFFEALKACAEFRLGRASGKSGLARIADRYASNRAAIRVAVMCGPDRAAQRAFVIEGLRDPEADTGMLMPLIRLRALGPAKRKVRTIDEAALIEALKDRAVNRALDARAREPGPGYRPALGRWEETD